MKYLAVSNNAWGKGDTKAEARRLCKRNGGKAGVTLYEVPDDYVIDEIGNAHGSGEAKLIVGKEMRAIVKGG